MQYIMNQYIREPLNFQNGRNEKPGEREREGEREDNYMT